MLSKAKHKKRLTYSFHLKQKHGIHVAKWTGKQQKKHQMIKHFENLECMQKIVQSGKLSSGFWLTIVTLLCNNLREKFGSKKKNETNIIDKFSNSSKPYLVLLPDTEWKNMGPIGKYSEHYTSRILPKEHHLSASPSFLFQKHTAMIH